MLKNLVKSYKHVKKKIFVDCEIWNEIIRFSFCGLPESSNQIATVRLYA